MSICNCPVVGIDGIEDSKQKQLVEEFLKNSDGWSLLSLIDMYKAGNSLEDINQVVPFRGGPCNRSMRCCGVCTRQCYSRCIQDCLHRLYMWQKLVDSTPSTERDKLPLNLRMIVTQKFETLKDLSWVVGEILSQTSNSVLKEYMRNENLYPKDNPYKIDYAPQVELDSSTGKRKCNPATGELIIADWPRTGLCPYCLPDVTIDGRIARANQNRREKYSDA